MTAVHNESDFKISLKSLTNVIVRVLDPKCKQEDPIIQASAQKIAFRLSLDKRVFSSIINEATNKASLTEIVTKLINEKKLAELPEPSSIGANSLFAYRRPIDMALPAPRGR